MTGEWHDHVRIVAVTLALTLTGAAFLTVAALTAVLDGIYTIDIREKP